jgi:hypothetical protein
MLSQVVKIRIEKEALRKKGQDIPKDEPIHHLDDTMKQKYTEIEANNFYKQFINKDELNTSLKDINAVIFFSNNKKWREEICKRAKLEDVIMFCNVIVNHYIKYLAMFIWDLFTVFPAMKVLAGDSLRQELEHQARILKTYFNT